MFLISRVSESGVRWTRRVREREGALNSARDACAAAGGSSSLCSITAIARGAHDPLPIAFDGTNIWVGNSGDSSVTKLRASDGVTLGTFSLDFATLPSGIAFDGANIWITDANRDFVYNLRASDGRLLGKFVIGGSQPRSCLMGLICGSLKLQITP